MLDCSLCCIDAHLIETSSLLPLSLLSFLSLQRRVIFQRMCNVVIADDNYRKITEYVTSQITDQQMICDHNLGNMGCLQHHSPCQIVNCMYKYLHGQNFDWCASIASMSFHN